MIDTFDSKSRDSNSRDVNSRRNSRSGSRASSSRGDSRSDRSRNGPRDPAASGVAGRGGRTATAGRGDAGGPSRSQSSDPRRDSRGASPVTKRPIKAAAVTTRHLRTLGHHLKPVVAISDKGLTEGVAAELERALEDHELIKVRVALAEPVARREMAASLCRAHGAELIQQIGKIILIYRAARRPDPRLSNLLRFNA